MRVWVFLSEVPQWMKWDLRGELWPLVGSTHGTGKPTATGPGLCMVCVSGPGHTLAPPWGLRCQPLCSCHRLHWTLEVRPPPCVVGVLLSGEPLGLLFGCGQWLCVQLMRLLPQCPMGFLTESLLLSRTLLGIDLLSGSPEEHLPVNQSWLSGLRRSDDPAGASFFPVRA